MSKDDKPSSTTATLPGIQALRALAASAVLVAHTGGEFEQHLSLPGLGPNFGVGSAGVDLFFVISGFVMVYSSERLFGDRASFRTFLTRRAIRIVPLYWTMTSVMLVWVLVRGLQRLMQAQFTRSLLIFSFPIRDRPVPLIRCMAWGGPSTMR